MRIQTQRWFWYWATAALLLGPIINPGAGSAQGQAFQSGSPYLRLVWARVADHNGELGSVECAEFSPDGRHIATATKYSNEIAVWRVADGARVWNQKVEQEVERVMFSPDGKLLDDLPTISIRISADGRFVAAGGQGGHIFVWNFADGTLAKKINYTGRKIETVCFTPDGQHLLFAGHDQHIRVLRVNDWSSVFQSEAVDNMEYLSFSRNGSFLASAHQDGLVRLWVWMRGDPNLNKRLHEELMKRQAEEDARSKGQTKN